MRAVCQVLHEREFVVVVFAAKHAEVKLGRLVLEEGVGHLGAASVVVKRISEVAAALFAWEEPVAERTLTCAFTTEDGVVALPPSVTGVPTASTAFQKAIYNLSVPGRVECPPGRASIVDLVLGSCAEYCRIPSARLGPLSS